MAAITPANVVALTDKITAWYLAAKSGLGTGTSGASQKAADLQNLTLALQDYQQLSLLLQPSESVRVASLATVFAPATIAPYLSALSNLCAQAGIQGANDLDSFATYYNLTTTTKWQCLFAPDLRELWGLWRNGNYPSPHNVYFEVLQGSTYPNALRKLVVGTGQTSGYDIPATQYAGGFPQLKWTDVSGSGTVQVAGTWRKTDGTTATGTGSVNVSGASGTASITPPFTGALILDCSGITPAAGITAGTFYVEAVRPTGRTNPPT